MTLFVGNWSDLRSSLVYIYGENINFKPTRNALETGKNRSKKQTFGNANMHIAALFGINMVIDVFDDICIYNKAIFIPALGVVSIFVIRIVDLSSEDKLF